MTDPNIDNQLKLAEIEKLKAEALKLQVEANHTEKSKKTFMWSETIKSIGAIVIGIGGIVAAITQYQISDLKAQETKLAINEKTKQLSTTKQELKEIETKRDVAIKERYDIVISVNKLKSELSNLTYQVTEKSPNLINKKLVYVQFRGELTRSFIDDYRESIKSIGFNPPSAERLAGTYNNLVKYFNPSDQDKAINLARATEDYFQTKGCPTSFKLVDASTTNTSNSSLEVWIHQACKA